jgi:hypothetical protein
MGIVIVLLVYFLYFLLAVAAVSLPIGILGSIGNALAFRFSRRDDNTMLKGALFVVLAAVAAIVVRIAGRTALGASEPYHSWLFWAFVYFVALAVLPTVGFAIYLLFKGIGSLFEGFLSLLRGERV